MRGIAAIMACIYVLATMGTSIANGYRNAIDGFLGTSSYVTVTDENSLRFKSDYDTIQDLAAAAKDIAIREGEEGTVVMKNDNDVLPLSTSEVALFGLAAYAPYPYTSGDLKAGNEDAVDLVAALEEAGVKINESFKTFYLEKILNKHIEQVANAWTGELVDTVAYDNIYVTSPGDFGDYRIVEVTPDRFESFGGPSDWKSLIDKDNTTGICVFARGAGEGNTYRPGSALDSQGNPTGKDPLALSDEELAVIDAAKEACAKVVVLINSGNTMVLKDIAEGGEHEVDGIAYIGVLNDYQATGIVRVLTGAVNATGALPDTYVADNSSIPAVVNFGGDFYADYEIVASSGTDSRYPGVEIGNGMAGSFGGSDTYNGGTYIVEAEGIYVGYKYYETAYAEAQAGRSDFDYDQEVVYPFGYGLSYTTFKQEMGALTENGDTLGFDVTVTNTGSVAGKDVVQIYFNPPYTNGGIEKSAANLIDYEKTGLLQPGQSQTIHFSLRISDMASYDAHGEGCYVLDRGDYIISVNANSHTVLDSQTYTASRKVIYNEDNPRSSDVNAATNLFQGEMGEGVEVTYLSRADGFANFDAATAAPTNYTLSADYKVTFRNISNYDPNEYNDPNDVMPTTDANNGIKLQSLRGVDYDDPQWDLLLDELTVSDMNELIALGGFQTIALESIGKLNTVDCDGPASINNNFTTTGCEISCNNVHCCRFTGTIRSQEAIYLAWFYV